MAMSVHFGATFFRAVGLVLAAAVLTAAVAQTIGRKAPIPLGEQTPLQPVQHVVDSQPAVRAEWPIQRVQQSPSPLAPAQQVPAQQAPIQTDRELALKLIPELLEMGVEVMPMGPKEDGRTVLSAVNGLRREQGLPLFDRLSQAAADYVDGKVDEYREHQANILRIQIALDALGFNPGPVDGLLGPRTLQAIRKYQERSGMTVTGELTDEQIDALEILSFDKDTGAKVGG
jgi:hypothetical protein